MDSTSSNPFELPEILRKISRFVTPRDAIACAQVCRAWADNFVAAIWHTIDFNVHKLQTTDLQALQKNGHHIRIVKNMNEVDHFSVLFESNASKLRSLSLTMKTSPEFQAYFNDLMRRNNATIEHIEILQSSSGTYSGPFFHVDSLFPETSTGVTSKLSSIKFEALTMTRDAFSSILRICPCLTKLNMRNTTLSSWPVRKLGANHYQHHGVTYLVAPFKQVFRMDNKSENAPSLLVHFPNLKSWHLWNSSNTLEVKIEDLRDEVTRCCQLLKTLYLETDANITARLLVKAFNSLTSICILNKHLSAEFIMAILNHQDTLIHVCTFTSFSNFFDSDNIPDVESNHLQVPGWIIQSVPRRCSQLKRLKFPLYETNIDDIEEASWCCCDLETLYIRVHGVNTKEKVDRAMQLWTDGRIAIGKKQMNAEKRPTLNDSQLYTVIPQSDNSIEARVARHLLKFNKLREVWLGWKVRKVRN